MLFDTNGSGASTTVADDPDQAERLFWNGVAFDGVTPTWAAEDL